MEVMDAMTYNVHDGATVVNADPTVGSPFMTIRTAILTP
jgi:hypothetical protein